MAAVAARLSGAPTANRIRQNNPLTHTQCLLRATHNKAGLSKRQQQRIDTNNCRYTNSGIKTMFLAAIWIDKFRRVAAVHCCWNERDLGSRLIDSPARADNCCSAAIRSGLGASRAVVCHARRTSDSHCLSSSLIWGRSKISVEIVMITSYKSSSVGFCSGWSASACIGRLIALD